ERDLATKDSPQGFGGHRSDRSAAQLGWPPGLGHSSGNDPSLTSRANTRVGKGALAPCPPSIGSTTRDWWARCALPTLQFAFVAAAIRPLLSRDSRARPRIDHAAVHRDRGADHIVAGAGSEK